MTEEVRVDPVELTRLGDQMLKSSQEVSDAWRVPPRAWFGPEEDFSSSYMDLNQVADLVVGRLVEVLEGDMDRLYRIAFAYRQADDDEARKIRRQYPNFPID